MILVILQYIIHTLDGLELLLLVHIYLSFCIFSFLIVLYLFFYLFHAFMMSCLAPIGRSLSSQGPCHRILFKQDGERTGGTVIIWEYKSA
jgi:hypothetical protein